MENLWKKESPMRNSNYVDLFAHLGNGQHAHLSRELQQGKTFKSNTASIELRLRGNDLFRENKIDEAMELYNKSLSFAEVGSESVSLVYANRSSCFLALKMYEQALIDIDLAVKANYPRRLLPKLKKRQEKCIQLMEIEPLQRKRYEPNLSFQPHGQFPCLASALDMKYNEKFGRHIVATRDIDVGKTILVERNFATVSVDDGKESCANCKITKANFIACPQCTTQLYCCSDCMQRDSTHKFTCGQFNSVYGSLKLYIQTVFVAISLFENVESLMEFVMETVKSKDVQSSMMDAKSQYRLFLSLQVTFSVHDRDDLMFDAQKMYITIQSAPSIKMLFNSVAKQRFLQHLVLQHLLATVHNRFEAIADKDHLSTTEIAPMTCMINHSCTPNAFNYASGNQTACITVLPVKQGDQLFISYLGEENGNTTDFRRMYLMDNYGFVCKCSKCEPCCSSLDRDAMKFDVNFKYIQRNYLTAFDEKVHRLMLKDVCIRFLKKFGHLPWSQELNFVSLCYIKWIYLYVTEDLDGEISLKP